jgi:hypothetical protein
MSGSTRSVTERVSETELEEENEIVLLRKRAEELEKFKVSVTDEHAKQITTLKNQMKQQLEKTNEEYLKQKNDNDLIEKANFKFR